MRTELRTTSRGAGNCIITISLVWRMDLQTRARAGPGLAGVTILVMVTGPQIGLYSCLRVRAHFHFTLAKVTPLSAFSFTFLHRFVK